MTKHGEKTQQLRNRKRKRDTNVKSHIDSVPVNLKAIEKEEPIEATVAHSMLLSSASSNLSSTNQLGSPTILLEKNLLSQTRKANKKRKRKKSACDKGPLDILLPQKEAKTTNASDNDVEACPGNEPEFPFPIDADDHCESPIDSYRDIVPLITSIGSQLYSQHQCNELSIYDPYYCDGAVIRHLAELGFPNVYNRKEDCYQTWAASANKNSSNKNIVDTMDVLITNPPYSGNHIEQLIHFVTSDVMVRRQKPWFLLLPQWVHKKDYFIHSTTAHSVHPIHPFYLLPHKRYVYQPPPNFRACRKSDVHKKSSPFVSMWYCWGGTAARNAALMQHFHLNSSSNKTCDLARSKNAIRDLRRQRT